MADKDFVVKNGLVVNTAFSVNSTAIYYSGSPVANSTYFFQQANTALTANNATNLGGAAASVYVNTSANFTLSGTLTFGSNVTLNQTHLKIGNSSVNATANSTGFYLNGEEVGGGYYKGNDGVRGSANNINNLFRINANTQSANITISAGENALTVGPLVINEGYNLTVETGGRAVIV